MRKEDTIRLKLDAYEERVRLANGPGASTFDKAVIKALKWVLGEVKDV